jgi:uncharacterized membrane protein YraQ (UPF0718 family)
MHDYELLSEIYNEKRNIKLTVIKWIAGLTVAFAVALLFSFLILRAIEIESRYHYVWDEEQQTYFRAEKGV